MTLWQCHFGNVTLAMPLWQCHFGNMAGPLSGGDGRDSTAQARCGEAGVGKDQGRRRREGEGRGVGGQQSTILPRRLLRDGGSEVRLCSSVRAHPEQCVHTALLTDISFISGARSVSFSRLYVHAVACSS